MFTWLNKIDTGEYYAMKELKKSALVNDKKKRRIMNEKNIFIKFRSPFVVNMYYTFQTPEKIYFIMDFINGGELYTHMLDQVRFSEKKARFYAAEICVALKALHQAGILYRDLKPNNILIDSEGHIKLIDFGLGKFMIDINTATKSVVGTPNYIAPDVLTKKKHTEAVDWWSFGVIIYEMISGNLPFLDDH